jgi:hypothetical protein
LICAEANSDPRLYKEGLAQAVDGVIFILEIYVTPLGATGFMRLIVGRNARDQP